MVFKQNDKPMRKSPKRRKNTYHYYYYYVALAKDEDDRAAFARSCVLSRIQWSERLYRSMMLKKSPAGVPPLVQCPHTFQIFYLDKPQLNHCALDFFKSDHSIKLMVDFLEWNHAWYLLKGPYFWQFLAK